MIISHQNHWVTRYTLYWSLQTLLFVTLFCVLVPFSPIMPSNGLDPSWAYGINQAVSQGLSFGREMIFTFGPYASIYTKFYHASTDKLMLFGSTFLAIFYWISFSLLTKNNLFCLLLALLVVLIGINSRDALLFTYPLIAGLVCFNLIDTNYMAQGGNRILALTAFIFMPFGLLLLIKGSMLVLCGLIAGISSIFFLVDRKWNLALVVFASPIGTAFLFWLLSGQSVLGLPAYFVSVSSIISGYTEAMSTNGSVWEIVVYLFASSLLLLAIACEKTISKKSRVILFCMFFSFVFVAFKGGFIRHDNHAVISGSSILIASLLALFILKTEQILKVLIVSFLTFIFIKGHHINNNFYTEIKSTYLSAWTGLKNRIINKNELENRLNNSVRLIKTSLNFPILNGMTDIYSFNQAALIASGNVWRPRPVLQSYSAYTPNLIEKNKNHLLGAEAPDNIIFRVEPIDGRIPSIEEGASWPELLKIYGPKALEHDFLFLQKHPGTIEATKLKFLSNENYTFGEQVEVPYTKKPIFAEITITPTLLGQLANVLFKTSQLQISLSLKNHTTKSYRIISNMSKSGLMISPLIENTDEFTLLYDRRDFLSQKRVKFFSITPVGGKILWKAKYEVVFKEIDFLPKLDVVKLVYKFDTTLDKAQFSDVSVAKECVGFIDVINGVRATKPFFVENGILTVQGWLAKSLNQQGELPESVLLALRDETGQRIFIKTKQTPRPDVSAYLKKPGLDLSGYKSVADVSGIQGNYTLGLAYTEGNSIKICPQIEKVGRIKSTG